MTSRFSAPGAMAEPIRQAGIIVAVLASIAIAGSFFFWAGALSVADKAPAAQDRCDRLCHPLEHHTRAGKCYCEVTP